MKNTARKMLNMPLLGVLRANLDDALAVFERGLRRLAAELDVGLDELDGPVRAGHHRLRRRAGEPVDHRAAGDQPQQERRRAAARGCPWRRSRPSVSIMMIEKMSVVAPTTAVPISTGLAVALNVLPAPSLSSRKCLPFSKLGVKPKSR